MSCPFLKPFKLFPIICRVKYESTPAFFVSPLALAIFLQPYPPPLPPCTPCPGHSTCLYLDQAEHLASEPLQRHFLYLIHSFRFGLAEASCGAQLKFLTLQRAIHPYTQFSPSCILSSILYSFFTLLSICNSITIQCSFVPVFSISLKMPQGQRPCLFYSPLVFVSTCHRAW